MKNISNQNITLKIFRSDNRYIGTVSDVVFPEKYFLGNFPENF